MPLGSFSKFMEGAITPEEAYSLTGGLVHPLEDIQTGLGQLPSIAKDKALKGKARAYEMFTVAKPFANFFSKQGTGFLITPPGILQENEEKKKMNGQPFTSLEAGNVRHNQ